MMNIEQETMNSEVERGADRGRTDDLLVANEALSQLSYSPKKVFDTNKLYFDCDKYTTNVQHNQRMIILAHLDKRGRNVYFSYRIFKKPLRSLKLWQQI